MECAIATIIACFGWSNLYLDGGLVFDDVHYVEINPITYQVAAIESNPYGRATLGYELRFRSATLSIEASHTSSLATTSDRGVNSIGITARWFPFRD